MTHLRASIAALIGGLSVAGMAGAYDTLTSGDAVPEQVATFDAADDVVALREDVEIRIDRADPVVGRTVGLQLRFNLYGVPGGGAAEFAATANPVAGSDLPAGWTVTTAVGGDAGDTFLVVNLQPPAIGPTPPLVAGELIVIPGIVLQDVEELLVAGGRIAGQTYFGDFAGSSPREVVVLVRSGNPSVLGCDPGAGDTRKRIDVVDTRDLEGYHSKTAFSPDGSLGGSGHAPAGMQSIHFGDLTAGVDPAFAGFAYADDDVFSVTVTGDPAAGFDAFTDIFLSADGCATSLVDGSIDGHLVDFSFARSELGAAGSGLGYRLALCGVVDTTTVIRAADPISVATRVERTGTGVAHAATCDLLPLQYNGSVIEVHQVNPAANPTAQSFLRIANRSDTAGWVQVDGIDDAGDGASLDGRNRLRFFLPAFESAQLNSEDLEQGNPAKGIAGAWGNGTGKWRAVVTAEFPGARVQALSRNLLDDTVTNLTGADGSGARLRDESLDHGDLAF